LKKLSACLSVFLMLVFPNVSAFAQQGEGIDSALQALSRYDIANKGKTPGLRDSVKVNLLFKLGRLQTNNNPDKSFQYATRQLALAEKINFQYGVANASNLLGTLHDRKGDSEAALPLYLRAVSIYDKLGDHEMAGNVYNNIGVMFFDKGVFTEGLKYLLHALEVANKYDDDVGAISAYINIGLIYKSQNKNDLALKYYFNALNLQLKHKGKFAISYTYLNIAELYRRTQPANARKYCTLGLQSAIREGDSISIANNYAAIGNVDIDAHNYIDALEMHKKAFAIREKIQDGFGIFSSYIMLAEIYRNTNQFSKARDYATAALQMVEERGDIERLAAVRKQLADIESATGNYKAAYNHYQEFSRLNDSLFNLTVDKKLTEQQLTYDFEKKQAKTKAAQQRKYNGAVEATKKQRIVSIAALAILLMVSIIAFWAYRSLRRNQRQKRLIEEQSAVIQQSLTEKETLLREIHHRVKNNLQIISSLLNIQSEDIEDANVLSSIQEGQSRVEAMSLIHQNLYQSEHLNNVDIENYMRELVQYLAKMFRGELDLVDVTIETSDIRFDIDTAIPLGLIVNELVSNAYKYAFDVNQKGKIAINIKAKNDTDYELNISNDGKPLPPDFDPQQSKSLGLKLVSILSRQLRGRFSSFSENGITSFTVDFKDLKAWQAAN
jgi:two-component sensor histidine kinase/Tfp pilus assembly protein PilF